MTDPKLPKREVPWPVVEATAQGIAQAISRATPVGVGFILILSDLGAEGNLTHVSDIRPGDAMRALEELVEHWRNDGFEGSLTRGPRCWTCDRPNPEIIVRGATRSTAVCRKCYYSARAE